jgi:hypothetical protein
MGADFRPGVDDDDFGVGLKVKTVACQATAILLRQQGLKVNGRTIQLHKEDPRTTHDCPGPDIEKSDILVRAAAYQAELASAGSHIDIEEPKPKEVRHGLVNVAESDSLNMRATPGQNGTLVAKLARDTVVEITDEAHNAVTTWFLVTDGEKSGWVSSKFITIGGIPAVDIRPVVTSIVPGPFNGPPKTHSQQAMEFFTTDKVFLPQSYTRMHAAGICGNLMRESYARMETGAIGDSGTAFGVMQARGQRQRNLRDFAAKNNRPADDLIIQLAFVDHELHTSEAYAWAWLLSSRSVEEATAAMCSYERPAGWHRIALPEHVLVGSAEAWDIYMPAMRRCDGFSVRLSYAKSLI